MLNFSILGISGKYWQTIDTEQRRQIEESNFLIDKLKSQVNQLSTDLSDTCSHASSKISELQGHIENHVIQNAKLQTKVDRLTRNLIKVANANEENVAKLSFQLQDSLKFRNEAETKLAEMESEKHNMVDTISDLKLQINNLETDKARAHGQINDLITLAKRSKPESVTSVDRSSVSSEVWEGEDYQQFTWMSAADLKAQIKKLEDSKIRNEAQAVELETMARRLERENRPFKEGDRAMSATLEHILKAKQVQERLAGKITQELDAARQAYNRKAAEEDE